MSHVSESLILLTKNEQMSESLIFLIESLIRSFLDKNKRFARKSNERIPSPGHFYCIVVFKLKELSNVVVVFKNGVQRTFKTNFVPNQMSCPTKKGA